MGAEISTYIIQISTYIIQYSIQGGAFCVLKYFFQFIGLHLLLKLMVDWKVLVDVCWDVGYAYIQWMRHFLPHRPHGGCRMSGRSSGCTPPLAGPTMWTMDWRRLAWDFTRTFVCNMLRTEKSSEFKSCEHGGWSTRVQNSSKSCWVVLAVWASAKSAERRIFHQDTSYKNREPHVFSKALCRTQPSPVCLRKLRIGSRNR